jgi:hypothetical protein
MAMNRNPDVEAWLDQAGPLEATMRFADLAELEAGRADLEAAVRAWCDWKGGPAMG